MELRTTNKKKRKEMREYAKQKFNIKEIPEELEFRVNNSPEQRLKSFDYFLSHSSKDHAAVQKLIYYLISTEQTQISNCRQRATISPPSASQSFSG